MKICCFKKNFSNQSSIFRKRGFTLIELLVVISIISLLSTVILASLNNARAKARDARRITDMKQLSIALELYRSDYGSYPSTGDYLDPPDRENSCGTAGNESMLIGNWQTSLESTLVNSNFISKLPTDPINTDRYCYTYYSNPDNNSSQTNWTSCLKETGEYATSTDYSYILYLELEKPPTNRFFPRWNNPLPPAVATNGLPANTCILGPLKK